MEHFLEKDYGPRQLNPLTLALVGDGVFELSVRECLVYQVNCPVNTLRKNAVTQVYCGAQTQAAQKLIPLFTEEEEAVFRRGRNAKVSHVPRNSSPADYHAATALEALLEYLCLKGELVRLHQLFALVCEERDAFVWKL